MHLQSLLTLLPFLAGLASQTGAVPINTFNKREVPQEKSHSSILKAVQTILQQDNPLGIVDPVFGLLGNAAASAGAGQVTNTDCLQQATADQAFTNAKSSNDIQGMTAALIYRALERNTGKVGLESVLCTETPVNPEIAAITQHQDPASPNAATTNKAITLELAKQIASIGGDPLTALDSGTFSPGDVNDPTGKGNTCDDDDCIFTQNLIVEDATEQEINDAVAGITPSIDGTLLPGCPAVTNGGSAGEDITADNDVADNAATAPAAGEATDVTAGNTAAAVEGIDVGQCTDFSITFAAGLDGRKADEFTFQPTALTNFNHGSALNPSIITQFMCDTFVNACGKSATTRDTCKTVAAHLDSQLSSGGLKRDQGFADAWLANLETAFGVSSTGTGSAGSSNDATSTGTDNGSTSTDDNANAQNNASTGNSAAATGAAADIEVGQCTDFSITFAAALDGRKADEFTFQPTDLTNFNHGSALNPSIITHFMCDTFVNACGKSASTRDTCKTVAADLDAKFADGTLHRDQGFADAWLSGLETAFGIQSTGAGAGNGANIGNAGDAANTGDAGNAGNAGETDTATDNLSAAAATGNNLQTFTGALNGVSATPVINIGGSRPFQVKGDIFVNSGAAFQRSCDQQFNGCANVANSGSGGSSVSDCAAQKDQCNAATPAA